MKLLLYTVLLMSLGAHASAADYSGLIKRSADKHNIDESILHRIITIESTGNPYAFNVDGESFSPKKKQVAIRSLWSINNKPWMVKIKTAPKRYKRAFFPTKISAQRFFRALSSNNTFNFNLTLVCQIKKCSIEEIGQTMIRRLDVIYTDIGIAQINYYYHGVDLKETIHWSEWFEPDTNIDYAAQLLAKLLKRFKGNTAKAVAYYHSGSKKFQVLYLARFNREWKGKPLSLESNTSTERMNPSKDA